MPEATKQPASHKTAHSERFVIEIMFANDGEPRDVFIGGCEEGDFIITRGQRVAVPRSVMDRLDTAVLGVTEVDPRDNANTIVTQRKRFSYTNYGRVGEVDL